MEIAEYLDHLTRVQSFPCLEQPSDQTYKLRGENSPALCISINHEVWSRREERPGSHYSITLPIQLALRAFYIN